MASKEAIEQDIDDLQIAFNRLESDVKKIKEEIENGEFNEK